MRLAIVAVVTLVIIIRSQSAGATAASRPRDRDNGGLCCTVGMHCYACTILARYMAAEPFVVWSLAMRAMPESEASGRSAGLHHVHHAGSSFSPERVSACFRFAQGSWSLEPTPWRS